MEESTTTEPVEQSSGASQVIKGVAVDSDGYAIPEVQPETTQTAEESTEETQPSSEEVETAEPVTVSATDGNPTELSQWAIKKGVDPNDPQAVLKMARESEQSMHKATAETAETKRLIDLQSAMAAGTGYDPAYADTNMDVNSTLMRDMAQLKTESKVANFYAQNPEARQYDAAMAALVIQNPQLVVLDIPSLYKLVKADKMDTELAQAKDSGAQEARKQLAKTSRAAMPTSAASTGEATGGRLTMATIEAMPFDEYQSRRAEIDEYLKTAK